MKLRNYLLFLFLLIFASCSKDKVDTGVQGYLNLDFEKVIPTEKPKGWFQGGEGFSVFVDSTVSFSGKRSLCIERVGGGKFGVARSYFPINKARGKHLKYTGYIKTENITKGYAGLWWRVDGTDGTLNFDNMQKRGAKGTSDWTKYTIEFTIDDELTNIIFGVLLPGNGKAWFDDLSIELDGEKFLQEEPENIDLSLEQIDWLKNNLNTFNTAEPVDEDYDLSFLKEMVCDAKIVSLGEGTHGTSEFFKMKHRITKYLVENMGFSVFAIEASMPEAVVVNNYVLDGVGDAKDALSGLHFWTWNTQEVLDMLTWMREYNASEKGRIEFWGFDMQFPKVAIKNTLKFLKKHDSTYFIEAKDEYQKITLFKNKYRRIKRDPNLNLFAPYLASAKDIYNHILEKREEYNAIATKDSTDWYLQNSRIVVQSLEALMQNHQSRDESMALNVQWIKEQMAPDTKIILWAHNGHVSKREVGMYKPMGAHLNKVYDKDMVVMGFGFNKGEYNAVGKNGLGNQTTSLSKPGSVEWIMHSLNLSRFFLDLRKTSDSPLSQVFNNELEFRAIGATKRDYDFFNTIITDDFDVLIYFEDTTPSDCFSIRN